VVPSQEAVDLSKAVNFDPMTFRVFNDLITEEEEKQLYRELEHPLERMRYENTHWDNA
jgi:hypothetical protein